MNSRQKAILRFMMNINGKLPFEYYYSEENGNINLVYYYGNSKNVRIPNNYNDAPITTIDPSCFAANKNIKNATIAEGIEAIY